jgi:hypothetical protein
MVKKSEKIKPGWYIPKGVKDSFANFCTDNGDIIQDSAAGAYVIWQYLPSQIREQAVLEAKEIPSVDKNFWDEFRKGLEKAILDQLHSQPQRPEKVK